MPAPYGLEPVLSVPDVGATVAFYRDTLGFSMNYVVSEEPQHAAVSFGVWTPEAVHLQFTLNPQVTSAPKEISLYLLVCPSVDSLYEQYQRAGVTLEQPRDPPVGQARV